jgi:hypothetical protein
MSTASKNNRIPLPFATAGIALCISYLFPMALGPIAATLIGFLIGLAVLFLAALPEGGSANRLVCPECGVLILFRNGQPYIG